MLKSITNCILKNILYQGEFLTVCTSLKTFAGQRYPGSQAEQWDQQFQVQEGNLPRGWNPWTGVDQLRSLAQPYQASLRPAGGLTRV